MKNLLRTATIIAAKRKGMQKSANVGELLGKLKGTHKTWATPAGALLGYGAARALTPEEDRNIVNQGGGALVGGAAGYGFGGMLDSDTKKNEADLSRMLIETEGRPSPEVLKQLQLQGVDLGIPGVSEDDLKSGTSYRAHRARKLAPYRAEGIFHARRLKAAEAAGNATAAESSRKALSDIEGKMSSSAGDHIGSILGAIKDSISSKPTEYGYEEE
jgi:hypothetical protein